MPHPASTLHRSLLPCLLFMLGACASFVTYMITRARAAGLLTEA